MKKKVIAITTMFVCVVFILIAIRATTIYFGNYIPNKDYFKEDYKQVIYLTSISDYLTAKEVLKEADDAFSTITDYENADKLFGNLGRFCITDDDAVEETHKLKFIAADFSADKGYMWVKYSTQAFDINGDITYASWDVLSQWELEKKDNNWVVTAIKEHP